MYDKIACLYHLIYPDWEGAIRKQATALNGLFVDLLGPGPLWVLDVSCGIGTQALGLAALGHRVRASDVSEAAISRARREAEERGVEIYFRVGDMRRCTEMHGCGFDVVLSADNSIPHLLSDEEILTALHSFRRALRPGGVAVVGLRDYSSDDDRSSPQVWPYGFRWDGDHRYYVFQTRDWEGDHYAVAMYFVREARPGSPALVTAGTSRYYAISVNRLMALFGDAGFVGVQRLDGLLYQPVVTGRRPSG